MYALVGIYPRLKMLAVEEALVEPPRAKLEFETGPLFLPFLDSITFI